MKIVKDDVEYRLLDDGGHILLRKNNIPKEFQTLGLAYYKE